MQSHPAATTQSTRCCCGTYELGSYAAVEVDRPGQIGREVHEPSWCMDQWNPHTGGYRIVRKPLDLLRG